MISDYIDKEKELTIHVLSGTILVDDLIGIVKSMYDSETTPNHLWDLTEANVSQIQADDLDRLATFAKTYSPTRIGHRTAFVSTSDLGFGLSRMYQIFAELAKQRVLIGVFRSREEAEQWILS